MNRLGFSRLCWLSVSLMAGPATAQGVAAPATYGDRQLGSFGDIDQGHFGDTAKGNFIENNFPRTQEGQVRPLDAQPNRASQSIFRKPEPAQSDSPYVTLPKPADASH